MDFRQNVNKTDDFERLSPPSDQLQHNDEELFGEFGVPSASKNHLIDPEVDYGHGATNMAYTHPTFNNPYMAAQGMTNTHAAYNYGDIIPGTNAQSNDASPYGFGGQSGNGAAVTSFEDPILFNILRDLDMPDGEQTTFNETDTSTQTHLHQNLPQFGSGNLTDYSFPDSAYNNHAAFAGTAPVPYPINRTFMEPTMEEDTPKAAPLSEIGSPPMNFTHRSQKRRATSSASRDTPEASRLKKQCAGCEKAFYTSKDPDGLRCTRCYDKHVKHTAGHTTYVFDPEMTIDHAWRRLYPRLEPMAILGDDVEAAKANEQEFIRRLIDAISTPYVSDESGSKEDNQRVAQQAKLNKKPFDSTQYRHHLVNARVRFLFQIAVRYHAGGESLYDTGGDNSGYGEDRTMKFSERIGRIIQLLTFDKDIAMDVIEGRGVTALVHNPNKYERRKRDNKKSNDTKQDLQEKGKQLHMLERGASASPASPLEPALPTQFASSRGGYPIDSIATVAGLPTSSRQWVPSSAGGQASAAGNGGNTSAPGGSNELEGYVPARHN